MKRYENIYKRVEQYEKKHGIEYATADGRLFKWLRLALLLTYMYKLVMNLIYIVGIVFMHNVDGREYNYPVLVSVSICTAVMVTGRIFIYTHNLKLKTAGLFSIFVSLPVQAVSFMQVMRGNDGIRPAFYYMHLAPIVVLAVLCVWLLVIIFRARYIKNSIYEKIVSNLYSAYHKDKSPGEALKTVSDEEWENFLKTYDKDNYKQQF